MEGMCWSVATGIYDEAFAILTNQIVLVVMPIASTCSEGLPLATKTTSEGARIEQVTVDFTLKPLIFSAFVSFQPAVDNSALPCSQPRQKLSYISRATTAISPSCLSILPSFTQMMTQPTSCSI